MIMTSLSLAMGCGGLCVVEASPEKALEEEYAGRLMTLISDSFEPHKKSQTEFTVSLLPFHPTQNTISFIDILSRKEIYITRAMFFHYGLVKDSGGNLSFSSSFGIRIGISHLRIDRDIHLGKEERSEEFNFFTSLRRDALAHPKTSPIP
jgi:hypothetical protein